MFQDKLLECRKKAGLSQEELARQLGVSRQSVSKWENGSSFPEIDKCIEICKLFHISLDELFLDEPTQSIDENVIHNISSVLQKNNHRLRVIFGISLSFVALMTFICFGCLSFLYSQLQGAQNNLATLNLNYAELSSELRHLQLQLDQYQSDLNDVIQLEFKSFQYLNNKEGRVHLETRFPKEKKNDRVQVILEYDSIQKKIDLTKNHLVYEADVVLPIEAVNKATVVVENGKDIMNYDCQMNDNGFTSKDSLNSGWHLKNIEKDEDILFFDFIGTGTDKNPSVKKIKNIEFVDDKNHMISKPLLTSKFQHKVNFKLSENPGKYRIYCTYEKNGFQLRQFIGWISYERNRFNVDELEFVEADVSLNSDSIEIIDES